VLLEMVDRPPPRWTVVETPPKGRAKLGERYGVCPSCGERAPLAKKPKRLQCAHCKWEFEVAWSESYLATVVRHAHIILNPAAGRGRRRAEPRIRSPARSASRAGWST